MSNVTILLIFDLNIALLFLNVSNPSQKSLFQFYIEIPLFMEYCTCTTLHTNDVKQRIYFQARHVACCSSLHLSPPPCAKSSFVSHMYYFTANTYNASLLLVQDRCIVIRNKRLHSSCAWAFLLLNAVYLRKRAYVSHNLKKIIRVTELCFYSDSFFKKK